MNGGHLVYLVHFNGRLVVSNTILWIVSSILSLLITMPIEWHIEWFNMRLVPLVCELFTNKQISEWIWIWICEFVYRLHRFKLAEMRSKTEPAHVNEVGHFWVFLEFWSVRKVFERPRDYAKRVGGWRIDSCGSKVSSVYSCPIASSHRSLILDWSCQISCVNPATMDF